MVGEKTDAENANSKDFGKKMCRASKEDPEEKYFEGKCQVCWQTVQEGWTSEAIIRQI